MQATQIVTTVPGFDDLSAQSVLSEIGIDMSRFPSDAHLLSWACICPRNDESAGKRRSTRMRKGSRWLKATLFSAPGRPSRTKGSYFQAQFHRIKARRGAKKAIGAVAASLLRTIYHMLKDGTLYQTSAPTTSTSGTRPPPPVASFNASRTSGSPYSSPRPRMTRV